MNSPEQFGVGNYVEAMLREMASKGIRLGGVELVMVPELPAAIAAVAQRESQPQRVHWNEYGFVVGFSGQELAGTAPAFAATDVRIQIGGTDVFRQGTGNGGAFAPMLMLFAGGHRPLIRRVGPDQDWLVTFKNFDGAATRTPRAGFDFLPDRALSQNKLPQPSAR